MSFEGVPWAIGGGASHSDELLRVACNAWTRDAEGIVLPGDMKVTALGTPGTAVQIAGGAVIVRNTQAAGQSYIGRAGSVTQISPASTGVGVTRSDLIIVRVKDPDFSPWSPPGDLANGPYFEPFIQAGVGAGVTTAAGAGITYAAVALARITIPPSTTVFTNGMITDLRVLAQPRIGFAYDVQAGASPADYILISETSYVDWPLNSLQVPVPRWATHAQVTASMSVSAEGPCNANVRCNLGGATGPVYAFDYNGALLNGAELLPFSTYGEFNVTGVQGTTVTLKTQAQRVNVGATGNVGIGPQQQVVYDVRFSERII
jgi:hypothetical protein